MPVQDVGISEGRYINMEENMEEKMVTILNEMADKTEISVYNMIGFLYPYL